MFCMLLRKHLTGGRLIAIRQDGLERILFLDFQCTNELGDSVVITLACEIMGRCSNLVVIRQDGTILDCLRRVDASVSRERMVLPGMTYAMPPREERLCLLDADRDALTRLVTPMQPGKLAKQLVAGMEGISPLLARGGRITPFGAVSQSVIRLSRSRRIGWYLPCSRPGASFWGNSLLIMPRCVPGRVC